MQRTGRACNGAFLPLVAVGVLVAGRFDTLPIPLQKLAKTIAGNLQVLFSAAFAAVDLHHAAVIDGCADLPFQCVSLAAQPQPEE